VRVSEREKPCRCFGKGNDGKSELRPETGTEVKNNIFINLKK
jgi:hypothetical protein